MKYVFCLVLMLALISCDNKKVKLDELNARKSVIQKRLDSITSLSRVAVAKAGQADGYDSSLWIEAGKYNIPMMVLKQEIDKINHSIDSLSKY